MSMETQRLICQDSRQEEDQSGEGLAAPTVLRLLAEQDPRPLPRGHLCYPGVVVAPGEEDGGLRAISAASVSPRQEGKHPGSHR